MEIDSKYTSTLYNLFLKSVINNYPNVSHCSEVKDSKGKVKYVRVIQNNKEYKFTFDGIHPNNSLESLKTLEDNMFKNLIG